MSKILGQYANEYDIISLREETALCKVYFATNNNQKRDCILKVINKDNLKKLDYDLIMKQLKRVEQYIK